MLLLCGEKTAKLGNFSLSIIFLEMEANMKPNIDAKEG
jgi:hypothetical protein